MGDLFFQSKKTYEASLPNEKNLSIKQYHSKKLLQY